MTSEIDPALTGAAFELANAGYTPMNDPDQNRSAEPISGDSASLRQAVESRDTRDGPVMVREYVDAHGDPAATNEAVTLARAARDHARVRAAETRAARDQSRREAEDGLDGRATIHDAADHSNVDESEPADTQQRESGKVRQEVDDRGHDHRGSSGSSDRLAPELELALKHPQVMQAIEEKIAAAEQARDSYREGLAAAMQIAQTTFLGQFPEFASLPSDQVPAALEKMAQDEPDKFARVQRMVESSDRLLAEQAREQQHQSSVARQQFEQFARHEDARLEVMLKNEPKSVQRAVAAEIMTAAQESGIAPEELNQLFQNEPVMRHATFQRMMYDAAKYRLIMKAKDLAVSRPVPPVLRPGTAATAGERNRGDLRALNTKLSTSGNLKDAVALYQARRSSRP